MRPAGPSTDLPARFRSVVQSPLRAGILRYVHSRPADSFDVENLMQVFGRMRLDVDNCVSELVSFGLLRRLSGTPTRYIANRPDIEGIEQLLDDFLERGATVST